MVKGQKRKKCLFFLSFNHVLCVLCGGCFAGLARFREDIRFDLISIGETVHQIEQADDGQHLAQTLIVQTQPLHGGGVRVNSVAAIVG